MKTVDSFLKEIAAVGESLDDFEGELDSRRSKLVKVIGQVESSVEMRVDESKHGDLLRERIDEVLGRVAKSSENWREHIEQEVRQAEFISKFDRSVIVMVYGKVNCAKSTLGNFIAGRAFERAENSPYEGLNLEFRIHDASEASEDATLRTRPSGEWFPTDGTECTSEIQEFTLGGLSWVDTPGIHSMTQSNQALAREYVEAAELVVYLTSSSSPARRSDIEELQGLVASGKPTLIAVTKFDQVEEDYDPEIDDIVQTRVPKSEESRKEQREWIESEVERAGLDAILKDRQYSFLSTYLADEAIRNGDEQAFEASGVAQFYRQLSKVLSRDAVELKKRNPKRKFNYLVQRIWGVSASADGAHTLKNLQAEVDGTREFVASKRVELDGFASTVVNQASDRATPRLEARLYEASDKVNSGMRDASLQADIERIIAEAVEAAFVQAIATAMHDVMEHVEGTSFKVGTWRVPSIEVLTEEIEVSQDIKNAGIGAAAGGLIGGGLGAAIGSVVPAVGTSIGGYIGGSLGTVVGGFIGTSVSETKTITVEVGTNVEKELARLLRKLDTDLEPVVRENLKTVASEYFGPLEEALETALESLKSAEDELLALRYGLDA